MVDQLKAHIQAVQVTAIHSPEWEVAIASLSDTILKRRPICRPRAIAQLAAVYGDVLVAVQQQLKQTLTAFFSTAHRLPALEREWGNNLMQQSFRQILDESFLCAMAVDAQQYQPRTPKRQLAIEELFQALVISDKLNKLRHLPPRQRDDVFNEAMLWITQHLQSFDAEKGQFLSWVNSRLHYTVLELKGNVHDPIKQKGYKKKVGECLKLRRYAQRTRPSYAVTWLWLQFKGGLPDHELIWYALLMLLILIELAQIIQAYDDSPNDLKEFLAQCVNVVLARPTELTIKSLDELYEQQSWDAPYAAGEESELSLLQDTINQLAVQDPEGLFSSHIKKYPNATFKVILMGRLNNESLESLSERLGLKLSTVSTFFYRRLKKLQTYIQEHET